MRVNELQKEVLSTKIIEHFEDNLNGKTIAVWGLAFKPETDDIREAPAITIISRLLNKGAKIKAYDPEAMENFRSQITDQIEYCTDQYEAAIDADALAIITEWSVFRSPDFDKLKSLMKGNAIFDGRNVYDVDEIQSLNFYYKSIGR